MLGTMTALSSVIILLLIIRIAGTPLSLPYGLKPENSSLVVIGAHYFGFDSNEPKKFFNHVTGLPWQQTILIEASPAIASKLADMVAKRNPTPMVPPEQVRVLNEGVISGADHSGVPQSVDFFSLDDHELKLPWWASQIGSFNKNHIRKHFPQFGRYNVSTLEGHIKTTKVQAKLLSEAIKGAGVGKVGVLIIDAEGLDCRIVASQDWGSDDACRWRPNLLYFERTHCSDEGYIEARRALLHAHACAPTAGRNYQSSYRIVSEKTDHDQNSVFALEPLTGWTQEAAAAKWF